jgi:NADPH:quinone reductase-like Zn-dependent oxidoreductase
MSCQSSLISWETGRDDERRRTMTEPGLILVTGAGGGVGGVGGKVVALLRQRGRAVRAMAHHDDDRADALRALGADFVVGDLTRIWHLSSHDRPLASAATKTRKCRRSLNRRSMLLVPADCSRTFRSA